MSEGRPIMRNVTSFVLAALIATIPANLVRADVPNQGELPSRVELHVIPTLWISDQQFLTGDSEGRQVALGGELRIAQGQGKTPLVILIHGSGGIGPNVPYWVRELNNIGVSTFTIDGMSGRGLITLRGSKPVPSMVCRAK